MANKNTNIQQDIKRGNVGEQLIVDLLNSAGIETTKNTTKKDVRSKYDLICQLTDNVKFTIEIKYDFYAVKSGNIAIEIFNPISLKNSGITVTESDLWCHIVNDKVYLANTKGLLNYVNTHLPKRIIHAAGDGNATIYLYVSKTILPAIFRRIDHLSFKGIFSTIQSLLTGYNKV